MTNTLTISRELAERLLLDDCSEQWNAQDDLRALLAAQVVQRSPKEALASVSQKDWELIGLRATVAQQAQMIEYLKAAPVVERQKPVAVALPSKRTMGVNTDYNRGVRDYAESVRHSLERQGFKVKELNQ